MLKIPPFRPAALSLKTRFALVTVVLFLLSVWGLAASIAYQLRHDMGGLLAEQQRAMANSIAQAIATSVLQRREALLSTASEFTPEILSDRKAVQDALTQHIGMHQLFDVALIVTTPAGEVLAEYPSRPGYEEARFKPPGLAENIIENSQFSVGLPAPGLYDKAAIVPFGAPILGEDRQLIGIFYGITNLMANEFIDHATDLTSDIGYLVISRSSRMILAANDKSLIMQLVPPPAGNQLLDRFLDGHEGSGITVNFRGTEELTSGRGVPGTDWVVAISMPTEDAFRPILQIQDRLYASAAILSLLLALLTWMFVLRSLRPLEQLILSVRKMGTPGFPMQPLDLKPSVPEIVKLVEAFNRMLQRHAEQAATLSESEARFYFVADNSPMLIWISDESGRRIWFNQTWLKTTGRLREERLADTWIDDVHPDDSAYYTDSVAQAMTARKPARTEFRLRDASGEYRWFLELAVPRLVEDDRLAGYVGSCLDIDEQIVAQRNAETLLGENRKLMAERFNVEESERRRMARDLHDDMGQWLTAISVNAEAICAIAGREGREKIHHCATSIAASSRAIHDFVRAMNRKLGNDTLATLGLKDSLKDLVHVWREYQEGIEAELEIDDDIDSLDSQLAITVFRLAQEALTNVARHAKASRVRLMLHREKGLCGEELRLSILDNGIGFDAKGEYQGVGLIGMRERALAAGGVCRIRSDPEHGTSVVVDIPLGQEALLQAGGHDHVNA